MAPLRIGCKKCDATLYKGEDIKPPQEIVQRYSGRCPDCGKKLSPFPQTIKIKPVAHSK